MRISEVPTGFRGVYAVAYGDMVKIGYSIGVRGRLAELQTNCPVPLTLLGFMQTNRPRTVELALHRRYTRHHHHGEWFQLTFFLRAELKRLLAGDEQTVFSTVLKCAADGCDGKPIAKGLCRHHYNEAYRQAHR